MQLHCHICGVELHVWEFGRHIVACQRIEMGLLADQLSPTVEELPTGYGLI